MIFKTEISKKNHKNSYKIFFKIKESFEIEKLKLFENIRKES